MESHKNYVAVAHYTPAIKITLIITRLIVNPHCIFSGINFVNTRFVIVHSQIFNCTPLKDISFSTKCLLVWCD